MEKDTIQRVRGYLKANDISILSLSKKLQVNNGTLTHKLNGERSLDLDTLCSILDIFPELSAEWLLRGVGEPTAAPSAIDTELQETCIEQAKEIFRLRRQLAELQGERKTKHA